MTSLAHRLIENHYARDRSELCIERIRAGSLAERFGTPLYVYSAQALDRRLHELREALGPRVGLLYALKANPNLAVAARARAAGAGAEIASGGELRIAEAAGFSGRDIQFAGPGKDEDEIGRAVRAGVLLNVESRGELESIARIASQDRPARVALRVNPKESSTGARMRMGGGSAKFGVDADEVPALAQVAETSSTVRLEGLHTYAGTQTFDQEAWLEQAGLLIEVAASVEAAIGRRLESLNFGGGFGVPVFEKDKTFDLEAAGAGLRALIERDDRPERRYFVELGRYVVAEAGVFFTRVRYVKESAGRRHAILDGGMHHHGAAAGVGTVLRRSYPVVLASDLDAEPDRGCQLGGPLCTPADAFPAVDHLPKLEPGDLLAFLASGAYGLTFSQALFLGHPTPAEVMVDGIEAYVVRERGRPEDALRGQRLPPETSK